MSPAFGNLTRRQRTLLARWLPGATVEADHSWGLVATTVLEVTCAFEAQGHRMIAEALADVRR
ncbi:hypothetical protein ACN26Z_16625 [Verrucosispora sp. WMMD703]|uniref:hypothetical protein n=1 Tax=Verrucosispora sp. WMMD703 TaxID=3403463 RepID=UPI003B959794